jgi:hypothetical protein
MDGAIIIGGPKECHKKTLLEAEKLVSDAITAPPRLLKFCYCGYH